MKQLKHLILIVALLCFVASSAIISNAAQPGGIQKGTGQNLSVKPGTSAPKILMQPLTVNMSQSISLCDNLLQRIESIKQLKHKKLHDHAIPAG